MKKYLFISLTLTGGLVVCVLAPLAWRIVGAFLVGGGCYAIIHLIGLRRIEKEIQNYEQPAEPDVLTHPVLEPDISGTLDLPCVPERILHAAA